MSIYHIHHLDSIPPPPWLLQEYRHLIPHTNTFFSGITHSELPPAPLPTDTETTCVLDETATQTLHPDDAQLFKTFVFGGILGDEDCTEQGYKAQNKDRGGKTLRTISKNIRNLGSKQMTLDTAVLTARKILDEQTPFDQIQFADDPEIMVSDHESTMVPFRYLSGVEGKPMMAPGMRELIIQQHLEESADGW